MSAMPTDVLELRAAEQRRRLHNSVAELREQVREKMDVKKNVREYMAPAAGAAALVGLIMGWGFAGMFTRR
ncbi:MAG TPA: hypothetical protein VE994_11645 [Terriglobales bacterium]|nr:hypothetical protein [Terriglobales bacterium]